MEKSQELDYLQKAVEQHRRWMKAADADTTEVAGDRYWEICENTIVALKEVDQTPEFLTVAQRARIAVEILDNLAYPRCILPFSVEYVQGLFSTIANYEKTVQDLTGWIRTVMVIEEWMEAACIDNDGSELKKKMTDLTKLEETIL